MITLSLAMIVKNEEVVLERCLNSVKHLVDEIIIVDTGSTDRTVEIAQKYTDKIYHFKWGDHFAEARNHSFSKATCDYIMWLDADDYLESSEQEKLLELKQNFDSDIDIAMLKYHVGFDEFDQVTMSNYRERILKRSKNFKWEEPVHECIAPSGHVKQFDIAITHGDKVRTHSDRNLKIYEKQTKLSDRGTFYYARELMNHHRFEDAIKQFEKFLTRNRGWVEDNIRSCYDLANCYQALDQKQLALKYLFQTFLYDVPRAETCCHIGAYFIEDRDYPKAVYWYDLALNPNSHKEAGFFQKDFCDLIPHIQLCMIFDILKEYQLAYEHHLHAKTLKPEHKSVKYNDDYFKQLFPDQKNSSKEKNILQKS